MVLSTCPCLLAKYRNQQGRASRLSHRLKTRLSAYKKMKRYGYLFEKLCSIENLYQAYLHAKRGKGWYSEVKLISKRPYYYVAGLKWMLENHKFKTSEYQVFMRREGHKDRQIYKLPFFPDRIVQWAIIQIIEPQLLKNFTADTYSAIPGRGIHSALRKLRHAMDTTPDELKYCLKIDCQKFYPSIDHELLKVAYRRKYKDPNFLELIDEIIDSVSTCLATDENVKFYESMGKEIRIITGQNGEKFIDDVGIPIGNYVSQYDGNFFLSPFDHWVKEVLHIKHYYRYMDDVCIFASSKEELHRIFDSVELYLKENLHLRIKRNYQIFPSYIRGIDFVGYRLFRDYTLLRKSTASQMKKRLTGILEKMKAGQGMTFSEYCTVSSYKGWTDHCDSFRLVKKYIVPLQSFTADYYINHIKQKGRKAA